MGLRHSKKSLILYTFFIFSLIFSASFPALGYASTGVYGWINTRDPEMILKTNALPAEPVKELLIPVLFGVAVPDLSDTWGDARSGGRKHEGIDILAPRGTFIVSPTDAVVTRIDSQPLGGNIVYTANPGKETYYFAHMDSFAPGLKVGDVLKKGDLIGFVGDTGNAKGTVTHLHFTIYSAAGTALNPYPRLKKEFTEEDRLESVKNMLVKTNDKEATLKAIARNSKDILAKIEATTNLATTTQPATPTVAVVDTQPLLKTAAAESSLALQIATERDLKFGMKGDDVKALQEFLIQSKAGPQAVALAKMGSTTYFGNQTKKALIEYQSKAGIAPASGYFGPKTKEHLTKVAYVN